MQSVAQVNEPCFSLNINQQYSLLPTLSNHKVASEVLVALIFTRPVILKAGEKSVATINVHKSIAPKRD